MKKRTIKFLQGMLFSLLMGMAVAAYGVSQEVQADLLMAKITTAIKAGRAADALPFFAELESMAPSLSEPLPEGFYYNYIVALKKGGDKANALNRAEAYLDKYGKKGRHYDEVIEIVGRLQVEVDKEKKEAAERWAAYYKEKEIWEKKWDDCMDSLTRRLDAGDTGLRDSLGDNWQTRMKEYCHNKYKKPVEPQ
jgi:hypothetical protein